MKCIVILFDEENFYENQKLAADKTARELTKNWADSLVADGKAIKVVTVKKSDCKTLTELLEISKSEAQKADADAVIYSYADVPFINRKITDEILESHFEYKNEYTFAPEVLDKGLCGILCELSKTNQVAVGQKAVARDSIWELLKTDINSFEVEEISSENEIKYYLNQSQIVNSLRGTTFISDIQMGTPFQKLTISISFINPIGDIFKTQINS